MSPKPNPSSQMNAGSVDSDSIMEAMLRQQRDARLLAEGQSIAPPNPSLTSEEMMALEMSGGYLSSQSRDSAMGQIPGDLILPSSAHGAPEQCAGQAAHQGQPGAASSSQFWQRGQSAVDAVMQECIRLDNAAGGAAGIAVMSTTSGTEYHTINTPITSKGIPVEDWRKTSPRTPAKPVISNSGKGRKSLEDQSWVVPGLTRSDSGESLTPQKCKWNPRLRS